MLALINDSSYKTKILTTHCNRKRTTYYFHPALVEEKGDRMKGIQITCSLLGCSGGV